MTNPMESMRPPQPTFVRPVLSLLAGLGIFVVLMVLLAVIANLVLGHGDPMHPQLDLFIALLVVHLVASLVAGLATGRMTADRSAYTVFLLALMLTMSSLVPVFQGSTKATEPRWFVIARAVLVAGGILAGGLWERRSNVARIAG